MRRVDWLSVTDSKGRWVSIFTNNQPRRVSRKCEYSTLLPCITYLKLYEKYVFSHVKDVEPSPTVFLGNEGDGIIDKALLVLCLKDVSGFDIPSSVALEILVKTGQCLAKFQTDTPTRIYLLSVISESQPYKFRRHC
jgi:hypothetical protein